MPVYSLSPDAVKTNNDNQSQNTETNETANKETKTINISGPLSVIYTQALNQVYAQEGSAATEQELLAEITNQDKVQSSDIFIYVTDETNIEEEGPINVFDKLRLDIENNKGLKIAVLESGRSMKGYMATMESFLSNNGVRVFFSRKNALDSIYNSLTR